MHLQGNVCLGQHPTQRQRACWPESRFVSRSHLPRLAHHRQQVPAGWPQAWQQQRTRAPVLLAAPTGHHASYTPSSRSPLGCGSSSDTSHPSAPCVPTHSSSGSRVTQVHPPQCSPAGVELATSAATPASCSTSTSSSRQLCSNSSPSARTSSSTSCPAQQHQTGASSSSAAPVKPCGPYRQHTLPVRRHTPLLPCPRQQQQQQQHWQAGGAGAGSRQRAAAVITRATFAAAAGGSEEPLRQPAQFLESTRGWRRRWTIVLLCFMAFMLCNMDRVNMSVAILPMSQEYGWDSRTMGLVQSSFFWGYLLTQVLGGILADRLGGKVVLGAGVVWWSLATALTPIAAKCGLVPLLVARALMGIGEGVAMPAMNNMLSRWVPMAERSRSLALVYSGMFLGSILGLSLSPQLIATLGWPSVFYIFGSMGVGWYLLWQQRAASTPRDDPDLSKAEKTYILANTAVASSRTASIPWGRLLSRVEVWAIIVCHFCHNWGTFILLTWMPTYYNQVLGCDIMRSGIFSVLPWMTMAISANIGGWLADTMVSRGASVTFVRKLMQTLGFLGPAFFLSQLSKVDSIGGAVACMMGAQGFDAFSQSGLYSNHQDIGPRYSGVLLGLSNTAGVLAGVLGSLATGHILSTGSWSDVWKVAVALYLVGTVVWNTFATGERIFD